MRIVYGADYAGETGTSAGRGAEVFATFVVTDAEGSSVRPLSENIRFGTWLVPAFGPFDDKLLFNVNYAAQEAMKLAPGLYVFDFDDVDGAIVPVPGSGYMRASWARDVDLIAQKVRADVNAIQVMRSDGAGRRRITEVPIEQGTVNGWLSISPDGRFVAYPRSLATDDPNRNEWQLWIAATDTDGNPDYHVQSVDHLDPWRIAWSPDGKLIAFSSMASGGGVWVLEQLSIGPATR